MFRLRYKPGFACIVAGSSCTPQREGTSWRGWVLERLNNHKCAKGLRPGWKWPRNFSLFDWDGRDVP